MLSPQIEFFLPSVLKKAKVVGLPPVEKIIMIFSDKGGNDYLWQDKYGEDDFATEGLFAKTKGRQLIQIIPLRNVLIGEEKEIIKDFIAGEIVSDGALFPVLRLNNPSPEEWRNFLKEEGLENVEITDLEVDLRAM